MWSKISSLSGAISNITKDVLSDGGPLPSQAPSDFDEYDDAQKAEFYRRQTSDLQEKLNQSDLNVRNLTAEFSKVVTEKERELTAVRSELDAVAAKVLELQSKPTASPRPQPVQSDSSDGWGFSPSHGDGGLVERSLAEAEAEIDRLSSMLHDSQQENHRLQAAAAAHASSHSHSHDPPLDELRQRLEEEIERRQADVEALSERFRQQMEDQQAAAHHQYAAVLSELDAEKARRLQLEQENADLRSTVASHVPGSPHSHHSDTSSRSTDLLAEISLLREQARAGQEEASSVREDIARHIAELEHLRGELATRSAELESVRGELVAKEKEVESVLLEVANREKECAALRRKNQEEREKVQHLTQQLDIACSAPPPPASPGQSDRVRDRASSGSFGSGGAVAKELREGWGELEALLVRHCGEFMGSYEHRQPDASQDAQLVERVVAGVEQVLREREPLLQELEGLTLDRDNLVQERRAAKKREEELGQEKVLLREQIEHLVEHQRSAGDAESQAVADRDHLQQSITQLRVEHEELQKEAQRLRAQLQTLTDQPQHSPHEDPDDPPSHPNPHTAQLIVQLEAGISSREAEIEELREQVRLLREDLEAAAQQAQSAHADAELLRAQLGGAAPAAVAASPSPRGVAEAAAAAVAADERRMLWEETERSLREQVRVKDEALAKSQRVLEVLRQDLVDKDKQLEDYILADADRDDRIRHLEAQLQICMMKEEATNSVASQSISQLRGEVDALKSALVAKEQEAAREREAAANLHVVLDQFQQADHEAASKAEIAKLQKALAAAQEELELANRAIVARDVELQRLHEQLAACAAQLSARDVDVAKLQAEVSNVRRGMEESMVRLKNLGQSDEHLVDRRIVIKLLVTYLDKDSKTKNDVLALMARILNFTDEDKARVGLIRRWPSWLGGVSSKEKEQSLTDAWIDFLLQDAAADDHPQPPSSNNPSPKTPS